MKIAVDQDDVMAEFTRHVLACVKREFGIHYEYEDVEWSALFKEIIPGGWDWLRRRDWLWTLMPATEGAIGGVQLLREAGHEIELVTSKPDWAEWTVWAWLGKWRPPFNKVTVVTPDRRKIDCTDADLIVDDKASTVTEWSAEGRLAIVYDRPWNQEVICDDVTLFRAYDWTWVQNIIDKIGSDA